MAVSRRTIRLGIFFLYLLGFNWHFFKEMCFLLNPADFDMAWIRPLPGKRRAILHFPYAPPHNLVFKPFLLRNVFRLSRDPRLLMEPQSWTIFCIYGNGKNIHKKILKQKKYIQGSCADVLSRFSYHVWTWTTWFPDDQGDGSLCVKYFFSPPPP